MRRALVSLVALVAMLPARPAPATTTGPPRDYRDTSDLSQPVYETVRERLRVEMRDGVRIYVEVVHPIAQGRYGTILVISPYHDLLGDRSGNEFFPGAGGLAGYFASRGYAVVFADIRGSGNSEGCFDYMGPLDVLDGYDLVEWAAAQPWSNERVAMTGHSYVGSTPILVASANPPHLVTIVPSAGLAQIYDHEFQWGVPYRAQWTGPVYTYEKDAAMPPSDESDPGWAANTAHAGCGWPRSALATGADYLTGRYTPWHAARDHRSGAADAPIPIFLLQGLEDFVVRPIAARWFLDRRRAGDKLWLGPWPHVPPRRGSQWVGALHRWFDRHLLQRPVEVGPPVEVFLNGTRPALAGPVRTPPAWPGTTSTLTLYPAPGRTLAASAPAATEATFLAEAGVGAKLPEQLEFDTPPFASDVEIAGFPRVVVNETIAGGRIDLIVSLYDIAPDGDVQLLTQAAMNPELREGLGELRPVHPGEPMRLTPPAWPLDRMVRAGHRLRLQISSRHEDKFPFFAGPGLVSVRLGGPDPTRIELGVVEGSVLYPDPRTL